MKNSDIIDELLLEVSVHHPILNLRNKEHLKTLIQICEDRGYTHLIPLLNDSFLTEAGTVSKQETPETQAQKMGLVHLGGGYYGKKEGAPATHVSQDGKIRQITPEEASAINNSAASSTDQSIPQSGETPSTPPPSDSEYEKQKKDAEYAHQRAQEDPDAVLKDASASARTKAVARAQQSANNVSAAEDAKETGGIPEDEQQREHPKGFTPVDPEEVVNEMPEADKETFTEPSDIPDKISTTDLNTFNTNIQKVASEIANAKKLGIPIPHINLCMVTVPGTNLYCDDNLGIPRDQMPQFKGKPIEGSRAAALPLDKSGEVDTEPIFREMLSRKDIKVLHTEVPADKLKATQSDLVGAKVIGMLQALESDPNHSSITAPIYVSRDGYVIDGHHRWAAIVAYNAAHPDEQIPMRTTVIDMDIKDAIPMANKFAEEMGVAVKKADANKETTGVLSKSLPSPKEASDETGGVVYSVGGGYYSDTPDGPAQYIAVENVVSSIFDNEDAGALGLLFEAIVTKKTSKGVVKKLQTIPPKDQKKATTIARSSVQGDTAISTNNNPSSFISGKNKKLLKVDTLSTKEFKHRPEPDANEFETRNKKYNILPPYKFPKEILKDVKVPVRHLISLQRMLNTRISNDTTKWSHFSDLPGGAGQISAQAGELMTLIGTTLDDAQADIFYQSLLTHEQQQIESNPKLKNEATRIVGKSWIRAAQNNRRAIRNRIAREYPGSTIVAGAWDSAAEVEALGLKDYKNNKGFSTDVYFKIKTNTGEEILDEVSLKKSTLVNFLNSGTGKFLEWDPSIPDEINPNVYSKRERDSLYGFASSHLKLLKTVTKNNKEFAALVRAKKISLDDSIEALGKGGGSRGAAKVVLSAINLAAESNNKDAIAYKDYVQTEHRKHQLAIVQSIGSNNLLKTGMLNAIKEEFPLKAVSSGEESMAIGEYSLDREILKYIFDTSDFQQIKQGLVAVTTEEPPYLAYRAGTGGKPIPIASILVREDGVGYGGQIKLDMRLDPRFAKILKEANTAVYR